MLCLDNQRAKDKVESLNISDNPVHMWMLSREPVRAIFYEGAVALLEKIPEGWMLSYMYTFESQRRRGYMQTLLREIQKSHRLFAIPMNSVAEGVLKKCGFVY
jgi:hypothetical protein